jgi:hypothetical protein
MERAANPMSAGPGRLRLRSSLGLAAGLLLSTLAMQQWLGPRPDLDQAMRGGAFWVNVIYALALAVPGFVTLMRPADADDRQPYAVLAGPVVALSVLAGIQLSAPGANSARLLMGDNWAMCSWLIALLSLPPLAGILLGLRQLAPRRPGRTGAMAGLVAGAGAAAVYTFHGPESAAPFILVWYTLGIAVSALFGAFLGTKMMRW